MRAGTPAERTRVRASLAAAACWLLACSAGQEPPAPAADAPALLDGLGGASHHITTANPDTQRYFDQGLALTYGFNHEAAVSSFREARRLDPDCAMCAWGEALALGPNINAPMGPEAGREAWAALQEAQRLAPRSSAREQAYVKALAARYAAEPPEDRAALDQAYADAMRGLVAADPSDNDAATLLAEALMDLHPWNYWISPDEPRPETAEALALLEQVMTSDPTHLGANHFYIHAVEEFHPERGVPAAERLGGLAPEAGHLVHMPSHIFWRVGRYGDAADINRRAVASDEAFFEICTPGAFYRAAYYPHNLHFLWSAASAEGISDLALSTARKLSAKTRDGVAEYAFLEEFVPIPELTLLRFGRFDAVLGEPAPPADQRYRTGIHHYARGVAYARTGRSAEADRELAALRAVQQDPAAAELVLAGGTSSAAQLLQIGVLHLQGETAASRGDMPGALAALADAVAAQDALVYMEPPPWYFPVRQALGAVLLQAGEPERAEAVYREDLVRFPENGWSLFGLSQSLSAQGRTAEADAAQTRFDRAWASADVKLPASRF